MTDINKEFNLNQGQQLAADGIFDFLLSDKKELIISGPAGVGKTYLMSYIIDNIIPRYHEMCKLMGIPPDYHGVVMTATTNKAAEVLAVATGRPTQTIHSFMNLRVTTDYDSGRTTIMKTANWVVHQNMIIFVDEASMVDSDLYNTIQDGTMNCKIIYVGDHNQLAPVMEDLSQVYKQGSPFYELTQPMRNAGQPALMDVCAQLRMTVETGIFNPIRIVPGVIDYLDGTQMENMVNSHFLVQNPKERILAYTNKRVVEYNGHVRSIRQLPDSFQVGEMLINNSAIKVGKRMLSVEQGITILRNLGPDIIKIDNIDLHVERLDIKTDLGEIFNAIAVPTDKSHFAELLKYYKKRKNWKQFYDLKDYYPDLRPRDAATVHKSQGSTYDQVFIDLGNISTCNIPSQVARMLYVAFSRAQTRVFLYGNLAAKYGGLIT